MTNNYCSSCGMTTETVREYHPFAVCTLFKILLNSKTVRENIKAVIEYGMKAERAGVSVDDAMADFNLVLNAKENTNDTADENNDHRPKDATMQAFERIMTEELGVEVVDVTPERS